MAIANGAKQKIKLTLEEALNVRRECGSKHRALKNQLLPYFSPFKKGVPFGAPVNPMI